MAVHIDEITSEVLAEPAPAGTAPATPEEAQTFGRTLEQLARRVEDLRRVAAEGFDD